MNQFEHFQYLVKMIRETDPNEWDRLATAAARYAARPCAFEAGQLAQTIMELETIRAAHTSHGDNHQ